MTALWGRGVLRQRKTKIDRRLIQNPAYGLSRFPSFVFSAVCGVQAAFFVSLTTLSLFVWAGLWYTEQNPTEHVSAGALIQQTGCEILR